MIALSKEKEEKNFVLLKTESQLVKEKKKSSSLEEQCVSLRKEN